MIPGQNQPQPRVAPTAQQIVPKNRKAVFLSMIPLVFIIATLFALLWWRIDTGANISGGGTIQSISIEQLQALESATLDISENDHLIVNGQLRSNGAFILGGDQSPENPEPGQVFFNTEQGSISYYDGADFTELADNENICYLSSPDNCGFATAAALQNLTLVAGAGISVDGLAVTNIGDIDPDDDLTTITTFGGEISGTYNNFQVGADVIDSSNVTDGTIANADLLNDSLSVVAGDGLSGGGVVALGGSVTLTLPACGFGEILESDGTNWSCDTDDVGFSDFFITDGTDSTSIVNSDTLTLSSGAGFSADIVAGVDTITFTNTGDTDASDDLTTATVFSGDVSGIYSGISLVAGSVGSSEIANGSVANADLANSSVSVTAGSGLSGGGAISLGGSVALSSTLGTSVDGSELADGSIEEVDLEVTNAGVDNYLLSYDSATGGFTWINPSGVGSASDIDLTDGITTENLTDGDTLTFVDGTNIDVVVSVTDTVTINTVSNPTFAGLVSLNGNVTVQVGDTFTFNGDAFTDLTGTGLSFSGGSLVATLGTDISGSEIVNGTIEEVDLEVTNGPTDNFVLSYDSGSGGYTWVDPTGLGSPTDVDVTDGITTETLTDGDTLTFTDGTNIDVVVTATDTVTLNTVGNPTFSGLVTLNGNATLEVGDTLTINGDAFDDLTGTGLTIVSGDLQTTLGVDVVGSEIVNNTIEEIDLEVTNGPTDNYALTYDSGTGGFTWVDPSGLGTPTDVDITDGITTETLTDGDSLTFTDGTNIDLVVTATDTLTANVISNPTFAGLVTLNGNATLQVGDTLSVNGDAFDDFTGTGLQIVSGDLQTTLGTSIGNSEIDSDAVTLGAQTSGNYVATITNGSGLSGSASSEGATPTLSLGALTADWTQGGAFDIILDNADSQLQIRGSGGAFYASLDAGALAGDETYTLEAGSAGNICTNAGNCLGGGGGSAPSDAQYLTLALDGDLSAERLFVDGSGLSLTDGGANGNATLDLGPLTADWGQTGAFDVILNNSDAQLQIRGSGGAFYATLDAGALTGSETYTFEPSSAGNICTDAGNCVGGGGGSAPNSAAYITVGNNATLSGERAITAGTNLGGVDDGADSTYTLNVSDSPTFSGLVTLNGDVLLQVGDTFTINGDDFDDLTGTGLTIVSGDLQTTLGVDVAGSEIVNGTIEEIDLEATNGPTDNYALTYDTATGGFTWVDPSGLGVPTDIDIFDGVTTETLTDGDTLTFTDGTNIDLAVTATDTLTASVISNPSFAGLVTLNGNALLEVGDTFTVNGDAFDDFTGTGLQIVSGDLQTTLGTDVVTGEIVNDTILAVDFDNTAAPGAPEDNYVLTYDDASGGFTWVDPTGVGSPSDIDITDGVTTETLTDGDTLTFTDGSNIDLVVTATDTLTANVISNPTFSGLVTLNGSATLQNGDTFTVAGDAIDEFVGTGLQLSGGDLQTTLGTDIVTGEISNGTIAEVDLNVTNGGAGVDGYVLQYNDGAGDFTWVDPTGLGSFASFDITDGGTTETIDDGNTITFVDGSGINHVVSATDTVTTTLGPLTTNWDQTGAFDISLNNASSELAILESVGGSFFGVIDVGDLGGTATLTIEDGSTGNICTDAGNCIGAGGGSAPSDAEYLVLTLDGDLSGERSLNPGTSLGITDNGADGTYDINTIQDIRTTANPTFAAPIFTGILDVQGASITVGQASTTDGTLIFENDTNGLSTTIDVVDATSSSKTITLPNASGTLAVSATGPVTLSALGDIGCVTCLVDGDTIFTAAGDGGPSQTISEGNTLTIQGGTDIVTTGTATDIIDIANNSTLGSVTGRDGTTTTLVNLNGGIAVDTSNFTVDGTTGAVLTNASLQVNGNTTLGTASGDTLTILGDDTDITFSDASFATCTALETDASGILKCGSDAGDPGSPWQTTSNVTNLVTGTDSVTVGSAAGLGKLAVDGDADEVQLLVQGNGTQTSDLFVVEDSALANQFAVQGTGEVLIGDAGSVDIATGNGDLYVEDALEVDGVFSVAGLLTSANDAIFQGGDLDLGVASTTSGTLEIFNSGSAFSTTIVSDVVTTTDRQVTIPDPTGGADIFCLSVLGNCAASGTAGGELTGSYPNPSIASGVVDSDNISNNTIQEIDLEVTNSPTNNYILSYDSGSGGFTWIQDSTGTVGGTGSSNQVAYWTGSSTLSGESNLYWDASSNELGIRDSTPSFALDVNSSARVVNNFTVGDDLTVDTNTLFVDASANRVGINDTSPSFSLDVTGTGNFTSTLDAPTLNTGQGDNNLYDMNQNVLTSSAVTFATINTGFGANELYDMNQHVLTSSAVTFATVNTGFGANELYDMNQHVMTSSGVTFSTITSNNWIQTTSDITSGGDIATANGTVGAPTHTFSSEHDVGFYKPGSNQIAVGINSAQELLLGATGFFVPNVYNSTSGSSANVYVDSAGRMYRSTSSEAYKPNIKAWNSWDPILNLQAIEFDATQTDDNGDLVRTGERLVGLSAEQVSQNFPQAAVLDDNGAIINYDTRFVIAALLGLGQNNNSRLDTQDQLISDIQNQLDKGSFNTLTVAKTITTKNLAVTGTATIGELIVLGDTTVQDIYVNGHIVSGGNEPTVAEKAAAGTNPTVTITGTDTAGTVRINTGTSASAGELVQITFDKSYAKTPVVTLTPNGSNSADLNYYTKAITKNGFVLGITNTATDSTSYLFQYQVIE